MTGLPNGLEGARKMPRPWVALADVADYFHPCFSRVWLHVLLLVDIFLDKRNVQVKLASTEGSHTQAPGTAISPLQPALSNFA